MITVIPLENIPAHDTLQSFCYLHMKAEGPTDLIHKIEPFPSVPGVYPCLIERAGYRPEPGFVFRFGPYVEHGKAQALVTLSTDWEAIDDAFKLFVLVLKQLPPKS